MAKGAVKKKKLFCQSYIRTMELKRAADEAGITEREALDLLASDEVTKELERYRAVISRQICTDDAVRRLAELAYGQANDCVRLVMEENADIGRLNLELLSELKRGSNGVVEIKLLDRVKVLDRLLELLGGTNTQAESFLQALDEAGDAD